jgi:DNA-binding transcriptional regulator YhcF (GntR family)
LKLDFNSEKPIFIQIADEIEEAIFIGAFEEETQIPSTTEISTMFKINPATVLKGMNRLLEEGIVYKKRGVGVFVSSGAFDQVAMKRRDQFYKSFVESLIEEAYKLGLSRTDILNYIEQGLKEVVHE